MCRVLNITAFWISTVIQGLPIFVNITGFSICIRMQSWKVRNIPGFQTCQFSAYAIITQGSKYAEHGLNNTWINCCMSGLWICLVLKFHRVLNKHPLPNMPWLGLLKDCKYERVSQGSEYAWISLNMS